MRVDDVLGDLGNFFRVAEARIQAGGHGNSSKKVKAGRRDRSLRKGMRPCMREK
jgi:hypothetical protein